jgi:1-acylglycerone phosphate reductase
MITFITSISGYVNTPWMGRYLLPQILTFVPTNIGTYAATKRSIELVADTLRLELEPFHVTVLCVVTGGVKTAGQTYFDDLKLPSTSLYKDIETIISRAQGHDGMVRMEAVDYAKAVADQVETRTSGKFWYGSNAEMVRQGTTAVAVPQAAFVSSSWPKLGRFA